MNSKFHKLQAEELIKQFNGLHWQLRDGSHHLKLAQIHATLANVPDEDDE